jgi:hypothetical protein
MLGLQASERQIRSTGLHPSGNNRRDKQSVTRSAAWNRQVATKPFSGRDEIILKPNGVYARCSPGWA